MSWIISTNNAQKIPIADASGEKPVQPESTVILTNGFTVPMATNHLEAVTVTVEPGSVTATATVEVYSRGDNQGTWGLIDTLDIAAGTPVSARYQCPMGQIRVKVLLATSAIIRVQGYSPARS